jgi:hypothetical protein
MGDQMRGLQDLVRGEVQSLRARGTDMEAQLRDLKTIVHQKVSGAEVAELVDRKL